ncbi:hypothetical protein RF11_11200 [Thelohanellus kitauei]|uniref:Tc1-like transposase DDE domain-containing protein n=1 Tax=Thelohanellus kitauei TaxID=669202 RepID=A0A0C2MJ53_THEKT|nr:hypothetical protein RF11_11200 [Thelohanellus kitauei]
MALNSYIHEDSNTIYSEAEGSQNTLSRVYTTIKKDLKIRIIAHIEKIPHKSLAEAARDCFLGERTDFRMRISKSTVNRIIKEFNITYNLIRQVPLVRNNPENIEARFLYAHYILKLVSLIFIRTLFSTPNYGRSERGEVEKFVDVNSRGRNISICTTMNCLGLVHNRCLLRSYNTREFFKFIQDTRVYLTGTPKVFVMDYSRFHHAREVRHTMESSGHEILDPIELLFTKWKALIKSNITIYDSNTLKSSVANVSKKIFQQDCTGWIQESSRFAF